MACHPVYFALALALSAGRASAQEVAWVTTPSLTPDVSPIDPVTGTVLGVVPVTGHEDMFGGITSDGADLLTIDGFSNPTVPRLLRIDPFTGIATPVGTTGFQTDVRGIAFDPSSGTLFATAGNDLYTVDPQTGAALPIATITGPTLDTVQGIAIDAQGTGWAVDFSGDGLFTFDLATGAATHLGNLNAPGFLFSFRDLAFDGAGDLWAVGSPGSGGLFRIDPVALTSTPVVVVEGYAGVVFAPCGSAATYCTAKTSSQGCLPAIGAVGTASASSGQPFLVTATAVGNNESGLFFFGAAGRAALPFQGGTLCATPPLARTPLQSSRGNPPPADCSGTFALDLNAWLAGGGTPHVSAGNRIGGQYWWRDRGDPFGVGLTDALEVQICP